MNNNNNSADGEGDGERDSGNVGNVGGGDRNEKGMRQDKSDSDNGKSDGVDVIVSPTPSSPSTTTTTTTTTTPNLTQSHSRQSSLSISKSPLSNSASNILENPINHSICHSTLSSSLPANDGHSSSTVLTMLNSTSDLVTSPTSQGFASPITQSPTIATPPLSPTSTMMFSHKKGEFQAKNKSHLECDAEIVADDSMFGKCILRRFKKDSGPIQKFQAGSIIEISQTTNNKACNVLVGLGEVQDQDKFDKHELVLPLYFTRKFRLQTHQEGTTLSLVQNVREVTASVVEVSLTGQYLSRSSRWQLANSLIGRCAQESEVLRHEGIRARVDNIWIGNAKVSSAYLDKSTRFVIRSGSVRQTIIVQMTSEMRQHNTTGDTYMDVCLSFFDDLLAQWQQSNVKHKVSIILTTRMWYPEFRHTTDKSNLEQCSQTKDGRWYRDYYKVVCQEVSSTNTASILLMLKNEYASYWSTFDEMMYGEVSSAFDSNTLESISLATNSFLDHHIDRSFDTTGLNIILISPGDGIVASSRKLYFITEEAILNEGIAVDWVCLSKPLCHAAPVVCWDIPLYIEYTRKCNLLEMQQRKTVEEKSSKSGKSKHKKDSSSNLKVEYNLEDGCQFRHEYREQIVRELLRANERDNIPFASDRASSIVDEELLPSDSWTSYRQPEWVHQLTYDYKTSRLSEIGARVDDEESVVFSRFLHIRKKALHNHGTGGFLTISCMQHHKIADETVKYSVTPSIPQNDDYVKEEDDQNFSDAEDVRELKRAIMQNRRKFEIGGVRKYGTLTSTRHRSDYLSSNSSKGEAANFEDENDDDEFIPDVYVPVSLDQALEIDDEIFCDNSERIPWKWNDISYDDEYAIAKKNVPFPPPQHNSVMIQDLRSISPVNTINMLSSKIRTNEPSTNNSLSSIHHALHLIQKSNSADATGTTTSTGRRVTTPVKGIKARRHHSVEEPLHGGMDSASEEYTQQVSYRSSLSQTPRGRSFDPFQDGVFIQRRLEPFERSTELWRALGFMRRWQHAFIPAYQRSSTPFGPLWYSLTQPACLPLTSPFVCDVDLKQPTKSVMFKGYTYCFRDSQLTYTMDDLKQFLVGLLLLRQTQLYMPSADDLSSRTHTRTPSQVTEQEAGTSSSYISYLLGNKRKKKSKLSSFEESDKQPVVLGLVSERLELRKGDSNVHVASYSSSVDTDTQQTYDYEFHIIPFRRTEPTCLRTTFDAKNTQRTSWQALLNLLQSPLDVERPPPPSIVDECQFYRVRFVITPTEDAKDTFVKRLSKFLTDANSVIHNYKRNIPQTTEIPKVFRNYDPSMDGPFEKGKHTKGDIIPHLTSYLDVSTSPEATSPNNRQVLSNFLWLNLSAKETPSTTDSLRNEWALLYYDRCLHESRCFHFEVQWVVGDASTVKKFISHLSSQAGRLKLLLTHVPIKLLSTNNITNPFRICRAIELMYWPKSLARGLTFLDRLLVSCGFVLDMHREEKEENVVNTSPRTHPSYLNMQYIHLTGLCLIQIPIVNDKCSHLLFNTNLRSEVASEMFVSNKKTQLLTIPDTPILRAIEEVCSDVSRLREIDEKLEYNLPNANDTTTTLV
eukprot:m.85214 g.85214  ORF g.85214 m.85214 type:complete len:1580 (+) comp8734_c0_seq1:20-4759(+)